MCGSKHTKTKQALLIVWSCPHLFSCFIHSSAHRLVWCFALRNGKCILLVLLCQQSLSENKQNLATRACDPLDADRWLCWVLLEGCCAQSVTSSLRGNFFIIFSSHQSKRIAKGQIPSWTCCLWGQLLALISPLMLFSSGWHSCDSHLIILVICMKIITSYLIKSRWLPSAPREALCYALSWKFHSERSHL